MKKLLVSLLFLASVSNVNASAVYPFHVIVQSPSTISASGWTGQIQVRPSSTSSNFDWVGGYLSNGTFVQIGIAQASPTNGYVPQAFVWHDVAGSSAHYTSIPLNVGSWYTFKATLIGSTWTYIMISPAGQQTTLLTGTGPSLQTFQVDDETWLSSWGIFPTAAFRTVQVRKGSSWVIPHLVFSPAPPICGAASVTPTPGLNLVFQWIGKGGSCYVVLS